MDTIKVVCGIIYRKDTVLLCRRKPSLTLGGYWEFPGGKVEGSETFEQSLARELEEELGMKVIVHKHFKTIQHQYEKFTIELISFICQFQEASFILEDHDRYEWVQVMDLLQWKLAPADIPIALELINLEKHQV